jgi:hypothetical protein
LVSAEFVLGAWGWHNEAGIHVLRLILSGTFEKFPDLQVISGPDRPANPRPDRPDGPRAVARGAAPCGPVRRGGTPRVGLTEALASGDPERIRRALQAVRESTDEAKPQLVVQPGDGADLRGRDETAG